MQRRGLITAEEAVVHPRRNEILRSVGVSARVEVEVRAVEVASGDRFLLCSDGLSGVIRDEEIATIVSTQPPEAAVEALIRVANERGGPDNITVQILSVPSSLADRDPEATAPIELSEAGLQRIERRRRFQEQVPRIGGVVLIVAALIGLYLVSRLL
jgi:protein phosphatase